MQLSKLTAQIEPNQNIEKDEFALLTRDLRNIILETEVNDAELLKERKYSTGTKSIDPVTWGTILVSLAASGGVLTTLITVISNWLKRHEGNTVTLEVDGDKLEVKGISSEEQQRLINAWLNRHGVKPSENE